MNFCSPQKKEAKKQKSEFVEFSLSSNAESSIVFFFRYIFFLVKTFIVTVFDVSQILTRRRRKFRQKNLLFSCSNWCVRCLCRGFQNVENIENLLRLSNCYILFNDDDGDDTTSTTVAIVIGAKCKYTKKKIHSFFFCWS